MACVRTKQYGVQTAFGIGVQVVRNQILAVDQRCAEVDQFGSGGMRHVRWLASGQSNMEFRLSEAADSPTEICPDSLMVRYFPWGSTIPSE